MSNSLELDARLQRCFKVAFPDVHESDIPAASTASIIAWDSMGTHILLAVVEEEFAVTFNHSDAGGLNSYQLLRAAVERRLGDEPQAD